MKRTIRALAPSLLVAALVAAAPSVSATTTAFPASNPIRPNGWDLDGDGRVGVAGKDDAICDGAAETERRGFAIEDVDGDGQLENQIYVDADGGSDAPSCGLASAPCASVDYALNQRMKSAPAPGEGVVCARGTEDRPIRLDESADGGPGTRAIAKETLSENQLYEIVVPKNPLRISGWDQDDDGAYPPFDQDDVAYTNATTQGYPLVISPRDASSRIELGHLRFLDSGRDSISKESGFFKMKRGQLGKGRGEHWHLHDIHVDGPNRRNCLNTHAVAISFFQWRFQHVFMSHVHMTDLYSYLWRGGFAGRDATFHRFFVTQRAIGGDKGSGSADGAGNSCWDKSVAPGADGGGSLRRIWALTGGGDIRVQIIDSSFIVDGFDHPVSARSKISSGINLCGWQAFNFSGNYLENYVGLGVNSISDRVCNGGNPQDTGNIHFMNNTNIVDDAKKLPPKQQFFNMAGFLQGNAGKTEDDLIGDFEVSENCFEWTDTPPLGAATLFVVQLRPTVDLSAGKIRLTGNRVSSHRRPKGGGLFLRDLAKHPQGIPGLFEFSENRGRVKAPKGPGAMLSFVQNDWSSVYPASNDRNVYPGDRFKVPGGQVRGLSAWRKRMGGDADSRVDDETEIVCPRLAEGWRPAAP